jgi:hypothetical protein
VLDNEIGEGPARVTRQSHLPSFFARSFVCDYTGSKERAERDDTV